MPPTTIRNVRRAAIPRGIQSKGWPILSYGFRPFFLGAGVWAIGAMALWLCHLVFGWSIGGDYGASHWHAHELLFGYAPAALAGFMLTAIPNWTGRLPVAGLPLAILVTVWTCGRFAMLNTHVFGLFPAMAIDSAFLPLLGIIAAREVGAGQNWRNLHIVLGIGLLTLTNILFHSAVLFDGDTGLASRLSIFTWLMLIMLIGGRLAVSFTHNWLTRQGVATMPKSFGIYDRLTIFGSLVAMGTWAWWPEHLVAGALLLGSSLLQLGRIARWRGWTAWREPLVWILHVAYMFVPIGLVCLAASTMRLITSIAALHLLTAGAIGCMTLAVMSRVTRGHTGRPLTASAVTLAAYLCLIASALLRPTAELLPDFYQIMVSVSGTFWFLAFVLFLAEYAPMLVTKRQ